MIKNLGFWIAALFCLAADQISKRWVVQQLELEQSLPVLPGVFQLTYVTNDGAALGLFANGSDWLRWVSLLVSLGLIVVALRSRLNPWDQVGCGCVLGGALGNGLDRFTSGEVIDFLDFRPIHFPWIFNLADVSINIGIACLLISAFWVQNQTSRKP